MEEEIDGIFEILSVENSEERYEKLKKFLLDNPDSANSFDDEGSSCLSVACEKGFFDCVSLLIGSGADVNEENCDESTPLLSCFLSDDLDPKTRHKCVRLLLDKGANVFKACNLCVTPLMVACSVMDLNCVKEILSHYKCEKTDDDSRVIETVNLCEDEEDSNSQSSDSPSACEEHDINYTDHEGETALLRCLTSEKFPEKRAECLKLLISACAKVNTTDRNCRPLRYAISNLSNSVDLVEILMKAGARISKGDLIEACDVLNADLIRLFINKGISVEVLDKFKHTPVYKIIFDLNCAENIPEEKQKRIQDCLKLLVSANANINAITDNGLQPIHNSLLLWPFYRFPAEFFISENADLTHVTHFRLSCVWYMAKTGDVLLAILKFLYQCGLPRPQCLSFIESNDDGIKKWLDEMNSNPRSLVELCKFSIRRCLGRGIKQKCNMLDLPTIVKEIILLKNILLKECFD